MFLPVIIQRELELKTSWLATETQSSIRITDADAQYLVKFRFEMIHYGPDTKYTEIKRQTCIDFHVPFGTCLYSHTAIFSTKGERKGRQ